MEGSLLVNIKMEDMVGVFIHFLIKMFIWGDGKMIVLVVKVYITTLLVRNIRESFWMVRSMVVECITIKVDRYMMDNGTKIGRMVLVHILIQTPKDMKAIG